MKNKIKKMNHSKAQIHLKNTEDTDVSKSKEAVLTKKPYFLRTILATWTLLLKNGFILLVKQHMFLKTLL